MQKNKPKNIGLREAFTGIKFVIKEEFNFRIHLLTTFFVLLLGIILKLSKLEWVIIIFAIFLVLVTEVLNTAIEKTVDLIIAQPDPKVKNIKDIAAGATLLSATAACLIGILIFLPKIWKFLNG